MPSARDLHKELNALKATEFLWMYEWPQEALLDLDEAFRHFFRKGALKKETGSETILDERGTEPSEDGFVHVCPSFG